MTNKMLALQETFKQKSALLDQAQTLLKEEFVGIDNIIDEVIEHVRTWFILSDFQEKPIILNLWGLTGTGKTTLVNRLMALINYSQKTYRFDLGEKDSKTSFRSSIDDLCENPDDAPIVIILDEIQHARTLKAPFREEIENDKNRLIWELMDSGKISYWGWKRGLWSLETYTKSLGLLLTAGVRVEQGVVVAREALFQEELGITPEPDQPQLFIEEHQYDYIIELAGDHLGLTLKNDLKNHLLTLNGQESIAFLHRVLDIAKRPQAKNFTKAIIFILGNLDEAYTMSSNYNTDISADEFHEASLKITVPDIKKALRDRFRDEQIARMGNIHIVYPAFSSASFRQIIALELSKTAKQLQEHLDIAFHWDDSLISEIYKEGVYPAQGARPLLTTIHQMVKSKLSTFFNIILDQELEVSSILLRVDKGELIAEFYQNDTRLHSHAQKIHYNLEKLRKPKLDEEQAITAVHEAGHAVLSITLLKVIPDLLVSVSSDTDSAGFMFSKDQKRFISRAELLPQTAVMLGGMLAEELIFGKEHLTSGAASDLERATEQLMKLFKKNGFGSTPIAYARHAFQDAMNYHNTTEIEEEVKALLSEAKQLAEQELFKYESLLLALADYLSEHSRLDKEQLQRFVETYTDLTLSKFNKSNFYRDTLKMRVQTKNVLNESLAKNPVVLNKDRG